MKSIIIAIIISFALIAPCVSQEKQPPPLPPSDTQLIPERIEAVNVAVLRSDGVLIPFAQHRSGGGLGTGVWLTPYPRPEKYPEADPIPIANLKRAWFVQHEEHPRTWYTLPASGNKALTLRASEVVQVENHCASNWALLTNYPGAKKEEGHHRNVSVAFDAKVETESPTRLDDKGEEWSRLFSFIEAKFENDEKGEIANPTNAGRAGVLPQQGERAKTPLTVEKLYRHTSGTQRLYYFEAKKKYPKPNGAGDAGCESVSFFRGWILLDGEGEFSWLDRDLALTDCDGKETISSFPLALVTLKGRKFLIVEEHGYEYESYVVSELMKDERHAIGHIYRLLEVIGGGC